MNEQSSPLISVVIPVKMGGYTSKIIKTLKMQYANPISDHPL